MENRFSSYSWPTGDFRSVNCLLLMPLIFFFFKLKEIKPIVNRSNGIECIFCVDENGVAPFAMSVFKCKQCNRRTPFCGKMFCALAIFPWILGSSAKLDKKPLFSGWKISHHAFESRKVHVWLFFSRLTWLILNKILAHETKHSFNDLVMSSTWVSLAYFVTARDKWINAKN